jgi:uncharacterized protein (DUF1697 family)
MPVYIALLRGVNVGGHHKIKMDALRTLCESIKLRDVATYIQSGNIVFRAKETEAAKLAALLEKAIEAEFGFRPAVIVRTLPEWKEVIKRSPFSGRNGIEPAKLLVHFLAGHPAETAHQKARAMPPVPEEVHIVEREVYIYFPNGMGRPKLSFAALERAIAVTGSGRNWNSVLKLLEMAQSLEASE